MSQERFRIPLCFLPICFTVPYISFVRPEQERNGVKKKNCSRWKNKRENLTKYIKKIRAKALNQTVSCNAGVPWCSAITKYSILLISAGSWLTACPSDVFNGHPLWNKSKECMKNTHILKRPLARSLRKDKGLYIHMWYITQSLCQENTCLISTPRAHQSPCLLPSSGQGSAAATAGRGKPCGSLKTDSPAVNLQQF